MTRAATPSTIARVFGTTWEAIAAANDLDPLARLQDGMILQVGVPAGFAASAAQVRVYELSDVERVVRGSAAHLDAELATRGLSRRGHKVKRGETLTDIATRYGLSVGSVARINRISRAHVPAAGDVLIVYVDTNKQKGTVAAPAPAGTALSGELRGLDDVVSVMGQEPPSDAAEPAGAAAVPPSSAPAPNANADKAPTEASTPGTSRVPGRRGKN